jgi:hypothetical protein
MPVLVLASAFVNLAPGSRLRPAGLPAETAVVVEAVVLAILTVGWAIAALVTSRPAAPAWAGTPAEQGHQDP